MPKPRRIAGSRAKPAIVGGTRGPAPAAVMQVLKGMRAVGLDADAICTEAGVSPARLAERVTNLDLAELAALWKVAAEHFGRATVALHVGAAHPPGSIVDYIAVASPTMRAALAHITRYYALIGRHAKWTLAPLPEGGLSLFEHVEEIGPGTLADRIRELSIVIAAVKVRRWAGRPPNEVWFRHAGFGPPEEYRAVLGCPVRFERERSGIVFADAVLDAPRVESDPELAGFLQAHAEVLLAKLPDGATFVEQVRAALVTELREGEPDVAKVARRLATSARSLQRRLQQEGSSFRAVVDDARLDLARVYLGEKNLSIADISYLLGYSDPAAFTRAFKRWTGRSPRADDRAKGEPFGGAVR
jgi:AraC-like DNA-binding protein